MIQALLGSLLGIVAMIGAMLFTASPQTVDTPQFGAANTTTLIGGTTYTLSGSGISSSATSLTLSTFTLPQNGYKIQDSDLSATFYITLEPGNRTRQEFVSCTTVVQNAAGTATLSGCTRGLSPVTPFTASSTLKFAHAGGTQVIFSDPPQTFNEFYALGNVSTSTNILVFSSTTPPRYDFVGAQSTGTYIATTSELASIAYVNAISIAGASNGTESVKGIWEGATALETASSTILGGTGAGLLMQVRYATDTPQSGCATGYTSTAGAGCSVIASLAGKIKQAWMDLTSSYTWTGHHIFSSLFATSASSTNATTTNLTVTGNTILSGTISGLLKSLDVVGSTMAVESTASTTVRTVVIPANTVGSTTVLKIKAFGKTVFNAGTPANLDIQFGDGSSSSTIAFTGGENDGIATRFATILSEIYFTGAATQSIYSHIFVATSSLPTGNARANFGVSSGQALTTTTFNPANQLYISFRAALNNAANTAQFNGIYVESLTD